MVCSRCGGTGNLPQYSHVENGVCFSCGGHGVYTARTRSSNVSSSHPRGDRPNAFHIGTQLGSNRQPTPIELLYNDLIHEDNLPF